MKKLFTISIILFFLISSLIPIVSSYPSYETNKIYSIHIYDNGTLSGYVKDASMNPIEGATIRASCGENYFENVSDSLGYYYIDNIPLIFCLWNVSASKTGYKTIWVEMSIGENTKYDFVLTSLGNTLYVGGSGTGNYTTLQSAIDNSSDGDTVFVYSGIYYENVIVDKSICLLGENKNSTIIDGSTNKDKDVICVTNSHVDIEKFTIKNGRYGILIDGVYGVVDNVNIVENIIIDNIHYGVFFFRSGYNNVLNNIISNNRYGIIAYEFCSNILFGNIISSSSEAGIYLTSAVNAGYCINNTISYNTLQKNGGGIILFTSNNNKINYNNFYGNSIDARFIWSTSNNWNYNYWNRIRLLPKPILGFTGKNYPFVPWINFDWRPAKEPYNIPSGVV